MKITAAVLAALVCAHPAHAKAIGDMATAEHDESAIKAKIGELDAAAANERVTAAEAKVKDMSTAHAAELAKANAALEAEKTAHAATKASLAEVQKKHDALAGIKSAGGPDAGTAASDPATAGLAGEALYKAEFAASEALQREFFAKDVGMAKAEQAYVIHRTDEAAAKRK